MLSHTEQARQNMIENQVRPWDVLDASVLETLRAVRREDFVPAQHRALAFCDMPLPIGHDEVMLKPIVEGRILQALALAADDSVLEIGAGTGFLTACLARLARRVTSLELHDSLAECARANLATARIRNATVEVVDAVREFQTSERYDAVVVGGAVWALPERFRDWVGPRGRLIAIVGESPAMQAVVYTREDDTHWTAESLFETDLRYLRHAEPPRRFSL